MYAETVLVDAVPAPRAVSEFVDPNASNEAPGPGLPSIRVSLDHLLERDEPWIAKVGSLLRGCVALYGDGAGQMLLNEGAIKAIATAAGLDPFDCWQRLARSIVHDQAVVEV